ncbi:hypothetical protein Tco_0300257 [Tanacetum coccineum]
MATNPNDVRLSVLMALQEAHDEEACLEEQILGLMHRFADRFTNRRPEINRLNSLPNHQLIEYGSYALGCMTGADMKKATYLKMVRDELLRSMEEKRKGMRPNPYGYPFCNPILQKITGNLRLQFMIILSKVDITLKFIDNERLDSSHDTVKKITPMTGLRGHVTFVMLGKSGRDYLFLGGASFSIKIIDYSSHFSGATTFTAVREAAKGFSGKQSDTFLTGTCMNQFRIEVDLRDDSAHTFVVMLDEMAKDLSKSSTKALLDGLDEVSKQEKGKKRYIDKDSNPEEHAVEKVPDATHPNEHAE